VSADRKISLRNIRASVSFVLRVCHHEVVGNNQDKDEDAQEIGKEAQVLVVKHLQQRWPKFFWLISEDK
jgi:hypothetical protein